MALHPHGPPKYPLCEWSILGHAPLPTHLPLCSALDPHAHALRPLSTFNPPLPFDFRLPPQILQPRVGSLDYTDRLDVVHDERRDDDGEPGR